MISVGEITPRPRLSIMLATFCGAVARFIDPAWVILD
jgi:hypothetical protein